MSISPIKISLALTAVLFSAVINAQPWIYEYASGLKSTEEKELTFEERQDAFNIYWQDKEVTKGRGFKQFRRWENFMKPRLSGREGLDNKAFWHSLLLKQTSPDSTDSLQWKFVGPKTTPFILETANLSGSGRLNCIAFHPLDSNIIYVGAPSGGFWMTRDGGENWETTTDMLSSIGISDIVVSHEDTSIIYLATGDGDNYDTYAVGIIKSTDGGKTWESTSLNMNVAQRIYFSRIVMNRYDADIMLATSSQGIYKTTDGWDTYTLIKAGNFRDIKYHPSNTSYIYATSYSSIGNAKIYRSIDGGNSFSEVSGSLEISGEVERIELTVTPADPSLVYAVAVDAANDGLYGIFRSQNSGSTWDIIYDNNLINLLGTRANGSDIGGQGSYDLAIAASPNDKKKIIIGGINNWRSTNSGVNNWELSSIWYHTQNSEYVHADQHMLKYSPHGSGNTLYVANDGGLYRSYDDGKTWQDITKNMQILQVYRLSGSKENEDYIICGNQDNGTFLYKNFSWHEILGGDGMECYINPLDNNILYYSTYYGKFFKSLNGGKNYTSIIPDNDLVGAWITPFQLHPQNPDVLYTGYKDVYISENAGGTWQKLSENLSIDNLQYLVVAPSNDQIIYTATYNDIYKTKNNGDTWSVISNELPDIAISSLAVSPNDPNKIWVSFSSYFEHEKVYFSPDGGTTWQNFSDSLPNIPVNHLVIRYNSNQEIYAGTDLGVYYRNGDMDHWIDYSNFLPNVIVSELEISESLGKLRAATYGRGIWELDLPPAIPSKANFEANLTQGCINAPINLKYTGDTPFDSLKWIHSASEIIYQDSTNDSIIVTFNAAGAKTIGLRHFQADTVTTEIKYQYLQISSTLNFPISPEKYYACDASQIQIYLPSGYEYFWEPEIQRDTLVDNIFDIKPTVDTTYLTVKHGNCEVKKEFVIIMPDDICNAVYLPEGKSGVYSNICADYAENEPSPGVGSGGGNGCTSQDGWCESEDILNNSVWFKVVVPEIGSLRITVTGFDTQIALYKAETCSDIITGGNYELIAANDDISSDNFASEIKLIDSLIPGDTLYLQVDGSFGGEVGEFTVVVSDKPNSINGPPVEKEPPCLIYPNPANELLNIKLILDEVTDVKIDLISQTGSILRSNILINANGLIHEHFDTSDLHGFYLIRITLDTYSFYKKVIIE